MYSTRWETYGGTLTDTVCVVTHTSSSVRLSSIFLFPFDYTHNPRTHLRHFSLHIYPFIKCTNSEPFTIFRNVVFVTVVVLQNTRVHICIYFIIHCPFTLGNKENTKWTTHQKSLNLRIYNKKNASQGLSLARRAV